MDLVIKNCKLLNENGEYFIGVENGIIKEISKTPIKGEKTIDIKSNIILPGFIDPHVHFRDPGLTHKEDFKSGSESAANGGFTTVIDMPNTLPKTNTYKAFKEKLAIGKKKSIVNFELQAGVNSYDEMKKIQSLKPIAYKIFMDLESDEELEQIFKDLGKLKKETDYNGLVCTHCENQEIVNKSSEKLKEKENQNPIDYSYGRPSISEDVSVKQAIELSDENNLSLHICHLSSIKSLLQVQNARKFMDISWEFTPHHLLLTNDAYDVYGTLVKTNPPLRTKEESININNIDENTIIGTDHAPHTLEEKTQGTWNSSPGIPNLETVVPLLLTEVNKGNIDLNLIPNILSKNAAERFQLKNKGEIAIGKDADFTIIDLKKEGKINIDSFRTKAEYSPFDKYPYKGKQVMTIVSGKIVMDDL
ncbi:dihydroorotase [Methanobrevibacter woesei]|uniref:dihydroorotase n=1 Tax=Methanobrevibacter woesei TaxID=190976 RepID=UPI00388EFAB3